MDDQNKNLILAMVLSTLVLVIWMVLFAPPPPDPNAVVETGETTQVEGVPAPAGEEAEGSPESTVAAVPEAERVQISTPSLSDSVSLSGGRIDDLSLVNYDVSLEAGSDDVTILSPVGSERPLLRRLRLGAGRRVAGRSGACDRHHLVA